MDRSEMGTDKGIRIRLAEDAGIGKWADFSMMFDHAILRKRDVSYSERTLYLKVRRNLYEKKKRKLLFWNIWMAGIDPTADCTLTIRNVEGYEVRDENGGDPGRRRSSLAGYLLQITNSTLDRSVRMITDMA